jgi:hypothetical protein
MLNKIKIKQIASLRFIIMMISIILRNIDRENMVFWNIHVYTDIYNLERQILPRQLNLRTGFNIELSSRAIVLLPDMTRGSSIPLGMLNC